MADERRVVAYALRKRALMKLSDIGRLLGVGDGQASRLAAEGETALSEKAGLGRRLKHLTKEATR